MQVRALPTWLWAKYVLFLAALCIQIVLVSKSPCSALCACLTPLRTYTQSSTETSTHKHTRFQLLSSMFVPLLSFLLELSFSRVIPGSVTLIQVQIGFKEPPNIEFAFISFSLPSTIWLTAELNPIEAGTLRWFPDECPCHFPLQTWDNSWKVLVWPSELFIVRKQGCGGSQPASQGALKST